MTGRNLNPEKLWWSYLWSPNEFFLLAAKSRHPMEIKPNLPDDTTKAICDILSTPPKLWIKEAERIVADLKNQKAKPPGLPSPPLPLLVG